MGGRGSSSGGGGRGGSAKPSYFGETEKAVKLKLSVTDSALERTYNREVWVPKSQLSEDGKPGQWITDQKAQEFYATRRSAYEYSAVYTDAKGNQFLAGKTARELLSEKSRKSAFEAGRKSYNELVSYAKSLGIKGVRVGMKRSTIEKKIRERGG